MAATQQNQDISFHVDALIDTDGAAKLLNIPRGTLIKWRCTGENNIPYVRIGRLIKYRTTALLEYVERHTHNA
ncbi:helix-turn-helix domain-containing protein [Methylotuvimicrobium sp. KM2]|uniref:helix-turn-helix domain-containing protein n=1 Tax=Methylotuvimicrobium sp. KM2 TaxID=3133976 RepID=UPI003101A862